MTPDELTATGKLGACEVLVSLQQGWAPWGGSAQGVVRFHGGARAQRLQFWQVHLIATSQGGSSGLPCGAYRQDRITIPAGRALEIPFSLPVGWGTPGFGQIGMVIFHAVPATFPWWPCVLRRMIDITPPPDFVHAAGAVAELAGLEQGVWRVISGGDGAAMTLRATDDSHPLEEVELELFRSPGRAYGSLTLDPRQGGRRRVQIRFPSENAEEARRALKAALDPILSGAEFLPIPSTPSQSLGSLPIPADPEPPSGEYLPRPSRGD